jgi:hypothetical protein
MMRAPGRLLPISNEWACGRPGGVVLLRRSRATSGLGTRIGYQVKIADCASENARPSKADSMESRTVEPFDSSFRAASSVAPF